MNTIKKNRGALMYYGEKGGVAVNTEKTRYMFISRHKNAGAIITHRQVIFVDPLKM
jgi:hypothetical protein